MSYAQQIDQLTRQFNETIAGMERDYKMERGGIGGLHLFTDSRLLREYSQRYTRTAADYQRRKEQLLTASKRADRQWARKRQLWEWTFVGAIAAAVIALIATVTWTSESDAAQKSFMQQTEWNADNIPIPYLQDSTQYVSNPDSVLSQGAVERMNTALGRLNHEAGIQSVVIVVNHIEGDDPFRMAQDVGNKYGVGHNDRGLVIVVGYLDHSINMSPGRRLEADLTDAECHRLEQKYVVPAMRAEQPDSGMVYLTEGLLALMLKKSMPEMSGLTATDSDDDIDDSVKYMLFALTMLTFGGIALLLRLNRTYAWWPPTALKGNPFGNASGGVYFGGGGFGSGGGGGGFSGGSFGGGSFGGGGATSRW